MLSVSEVRKILDEIAEGAGIQKIDEMEYGNEFHNVFYLMSGSESYFMKFTWYDSGSWRVEVANKIIVEVDLKIFTAGYMTIYPRGFDDFIVNMIKDRLNELITNYDKALKDVKQKEKDRKIKEILSARGKYDV